MLVRRICAALLLAGTALLATAAPALAHTELKSSDPASGAKLTAAPQQITLTFSEAVQTVGADIKVTGPGGAQWNVNRPVVKGPVVTSGVIPTGEAGDYTITWKVIADDGDPVTGKIAFTIAGPATTQPPTTTASTPTTASSAPGASTQPAVDPAAQQQSADDNGVPVWLWIVIGAVVIAAVVFGVLRIRRPKTPAE